LRDTRLLIVGGSQEVNSRGQEVVDRRFRKFKTYSSRGREVINEGMGSCKLVNKKTGD